MHLLSLQIKVKPSSGLDKRKYRRQRAEKSTTPKGRRECADLQSLITAVYFV